MQERTFNDRYKIWLVKNPGGTEDDFRNAIKSTGAKIAAARAKNDSTTDFMVTGSGVLVPIPNSAEELKNLRDGERKDNDSIHIN